MHRRKHVAVVAAGVLLLGLFSILLYLQNLDLNSYRDQIGQQVEAVTGRSLSINGEISLGISLSPVIVISDVNFANAAWAHTRDMFTAQRVEAEVSLFSLLMAEPRIKRLLLHDVKLHLETSDQGQGNWEFASPSQETAEPAPAAIPDIRNVDLTGLELNWRNGETGMEKTLRLDSLVLQSADSADTIAVEGLGRWNGTGFSFQGQTGSLQALRANAAFPFNLVMTAGAASLALDGEVARPAQDTEFRLSLQGRGNDLSTLPGMTLQNELMRKPWQLNASVHGKDRQLTSDSFDLQLGESSVSGEFTVSWRDEKPAIEARLHSDLVTWVGAGKKARETPTAPSPGKIFSQARLPLEWMDAFNMKLDYTADSILLRGLQLSGTSVSINLDDRRLLLEPFNGMVGKAPVQGRLSLDLRNSKPRMEMQFDARKLDLGTLITISDGDEWVDAEANLSIELKGHGDSIADMMATADGRSDLFVGKGKIDAESIDTLVGGLSQLAGTLVSEAQTKAELNCLVSQFTVRGGRAESSLLMADTHVSTVFGEGSIDLQKEQLDLLISPKPKSATLNVAVPIEIGGTLLEPTFTPEKLATARKAAGLLAIVGGISFPPAILLGLGEMGTGEENPCRKLVSGDVTSTPKGEKQPDDKNSRTSTVVDGVKGTLDSVGSKLKGLFGD